MESGVELKSGVDERPLVLIAEDAGAQVRLMQICMERAGCRVAAARDGREALTALEKERPAFIILDIEMPGFNGFQVLDKLRKDPATRSIPVIMLTGHAKDSVLFDEYAGPDDIFMTKPFSPVELIDTVRRVLAKSGAGASPQ